MSTPSPARVGGPVLTPPSRGCQGTPVSTPLVVTVSGPDMRLTRRAYVLIYGTALMVGMWWPWEAMPWYGLDLR